MNRITEAIEEIFWFPLFYWMFAMLTTIPMCILINNMNVEDYVKGVLILFPIGYVFCLTIVYSIKMKYGKLFEESQNK